MKVSFALVIVAATLLGPALAHAAPKAAVYVECAAQDTDRVGKAMCSSLRDVIAKSPRYELITSSGKAFHNVISIVSQSIGPEGAASSVVFGWAVGAGPMNFLTHEVVVTGLGKVNDQAASLLVDLDTWIDAMHQTQTH
jgi:hypothetical protein